VNPLGQEPRDGDFVAYLEALERRQLAALRIEHRLPASTNEDAEIVTEVTESAPPKPGDTGAVMHRPQHQVRAPALPTGAVVALVVGAVLLISALFSDGGVVPFVIGLLLLVHGARRLARLRRVDSDARQQALQRIAALPDTSRKR
jgi:hypothetical protein